MVLAAEIRKDIEVPEGVTVTVDGQKVTVKGPKGEVSREFNKKVVIGKDGNNVFVLAKFPRREEKALTGTVAGHITNMVKGVKDGYTYTLQIYYSHFPMNVAVNGNKVVIKNFLGEKHPRESKIVGTTKVQVKGQEVIAEGNNLEEVSQTAANLVQATKVRKRDPRVFLDGIFLVSKGDEE